MFLVINWTENWTVCSKDANQIQCTPQVFKGCNLLPDKHAKNTTWLLEITSLFHDNTRG